MREGYGKKGPVFGCGVRRVTWMVTVLVRSNIDLMSFPLGDEEVGGFSEGEKEG